MTLSEICVGELNLKRAHLELGGALIEALRWDSELNQPLRDRWLAEFKLQSQITSGLQFKISGITQPFGDLSADNINLVRDLSRSELLASAALDCCVALYNAPISDLADDAEKAERKWIALEYFFALRARFNLKCEAFLEGVPPPAA